jgi:hypothetical protein
MRHGGEEEGRRIAQAHQEGKLILDVYNFKDSP